LRVIPVRAVPGRRHSTCFAPSDFDALADTFPSRDDFKHQLTPGIDHSVRPTRAAGSGVMRKTVNVNILYD